MAKGEDAVRRKKNKSIRKKLRKQNDSSSVSAKVAAIIAAKKRRLSGKRRMCQGMCFSLPTPDDPFNDRQGKPEFKKKRSKKKTHSKKDERCDGGESAAGTKDMLGGNIPKINKLGGNEVTDLKHEYKKSVTATLGQECINVERTNIEVIKKECLCGPQGKECENPESPSKFLLWCLSSIENALRHDDACTDQEGDSLLFDPWGLEFWKCYSTGKDIMETGGNSATTEQIAWMVSSAADTIARKEKEGLSFGSPFLLFLVPSQEKSVKVRLVCKALKPLGIHTVSIHPGASLDHQIQGLKCCEPEFLVSTPERLLELVSLKAINISSVSMLVVDQLNSFFSDGHVDAIKSIKDSISGAPRLVVFNDCAHYSSIPTIQYLLAGSICRLSLNGSVTSQSSCIVQTVKTCASEEERLQESIQALGQCWSGQTCKLDVLYIVRKIVKSKLVAALKSRSYSLTVGSDSQIYNDSVDSDSRTKPAVSLIDFEHISTADIGKYDIVILPSFVPSIERYTHILTRMARHSVNGVLHSFLTKGDTKHVGPLIEILEQCGQQVPEALRNLRVTRNMMEE
ncbi:probable ATP-dependent RNA helicase ddx5 [Neltuma alba]|uniref:probable ATP-dependent RNA helicase ddx5 n=1 Tax=Neltuma alba TaxID=207710 RepID=UPI0010A4F41D|nr:probable ATP-dependent RNA helicase ddx5 [Prosopis alba]